MSCRVWLAALAGDVLSVIEEVSTLCQVEERFLASSVMAVKEALAALLERRGVTAAAAALGGAVVVAAALVLAFPVHRDRGPASAATAAVEETTTATPSPAATPTPNPGKGGALEDARQAFREGRLDDAIAAYQAVAAGTADGETIAAALLGEAVARFENNDRPGSVTKLRAAVAAGPVPSQSGREAAYLLGVRLNEDGSFGEAREVLAPLLGVSDDPLGPYAAAEYARAAAGAGDAASATRVWDGVLTSAAADVVLVASVYEQRAVAAQAVGDRASVAGWLGKLVGVRGDAPTRYRLAGAARELGDQATFAAQLRAIITGFPGTDEAVLAIGDLRGAGFAVDTGQEGYVYYRRRAYAEARRVLAAAVREDGLSAPEKVFRYYYLAAANEDSGNAGPAVEFYDAAAGIDVVSPYTHRAKYWAARVVESRGDMAGAAARYLALVVDGPPGEFNGEAKFRAGFALLRGGDARGALAAWERLGAAGDSRFEYWRGRARAEMGDADGARSAFEAAFGAGPLEFYGLEAGRRLGRESALEVSYRPLGAVDSPDWAALGVWVEALGGGRPWSEPPTAAGELMAVGLRPQAQAVLRAAGKDASRSRLLALAREAYIAGLPDVAAEFAIRVLESSGVSWRDAPTGMQRLTYPLDYVAQLDREGQSSGLDPLFLAAMVRQESLWDAAAGSRAGALGLTQVIPATGEGIARALGVPFRPDDLFRPAVSIRFGAYYLGGQVRRFGSAGAGLAAYNAGPGSVTRWMAAARGDSVEDFVEAIDIEETRRYVELVLEHYAHYGVAYRR
jgi:soluble lytic murein transglycosylase